MPDTIVIGAAQLGPSSFMDDRVDKNKNVRRILALLEKALIEKVKIICFPELALTDYFAGRMEKSSFEYYFDQIPNDLTQEVFAFTKENPISVILPYAEFDGTSFYNTAGIIQNGQLIGKYRKLHLPGAFVDPERGLAINYEKQYFAIGDLGYPVFDLQGVKVGVQICYDRDFPEGFRSLALKGVQIVFVPSNVTFGGTKWRETTWETFLKVRAFENNVFVIGVNKGGIENGREYAGESLILSPIGGDVLAKSQTKGDELVVVDIDLNDIIKAKK